MDRLWGLFVRGCSIFRRLEICDRKIAPIHTLKSTIPNESAQQNQGSNHTSSNH